MQVRPGGLQRPLLAGLGFEHPRPPLVPARSHAGAGPAVPHDVGPALIVTEWNYCRFTFPRNTQPTQIII